MAKDTVSSSKYGPSDDATFTDLVSATMCNWSHKEVEDEHNGTMTEDPARSPSFGPSFDDLTSPTPYKSEKELQASSKEHTNPATEFAERAEPALSDAVQRALLSGHAQSTRATQTPCKERALGSVDLTHIINEVLMSNEIKQMISSHVERAVMKELRVMIPCMGNMERDFSYRIERLEAAMDEVWESKATSKVARSTQKMPRAGRAALEPVPEAPATPRTRETRSASPAPRQQPPPGPAARPAPADPHGRARGPEAPGALRQRPRSGRTVPSAEALVAESLLGTVLPGMRPPSPQHSPSPKRTPPSSRHDGSRRGHITNATGSGSSGLGVSVHPGSSQASGSHKRSSSWSSFDTRYHGTDDMSTLPSGSTDAPQSKKTSSRLRSLIGKSFGWRRSRAAEPA